MIVYKPSAKAIKNKAFNQTDRVVFLGDGSAALYNGSRLIQSDVLYKKPDSHLVRTDEAVPSELVCSNHEKDHVVRNGIKLPFTLITDEAPR